MALTDVNRLFLDTNILIYATDESSSWHKYAIHSLSVARANGIELIVSPQILREYLSVTTRHHAMQGTTQFDNIFNNFQEFTKEFHIVDENRNVLDKLVREILIAGKQIHDANIVATMQTHRIQLLLTHNLDDFKRFTNLITIISLESVQQ